MTVVEEARLEVYRDIAPSAYDEFAARFIESAPEGYDNLTYWGRVQYDQPGRPELLFMIRESAEKTAGNQAARNSHPYNWDKTLDSTAYLVATTDGVSVTEWEVQGAKWEIGKAYWITHKTPSDSLVLEIMTPDEANPVSAQLRLSRLGGTFSRTDDFYEGRRVEAWLIGLSATETRPQFLDDPAKW